MEWTKISESLTVVKYSSHALFKVLAHHNNFHPSNHTRLKIKTYKLISKRTATFMINVLPELLLLYQIYRIKQLETLIWKGKFAIPQCLELWPPPLFFNREIYYDLLKIDIFSI